MKVATKFCGVPSRNVVLKQVFLTREELYTKQIQINSFAGATL